MTYFPKMKKLIAVTETTCLGCGVRVDFDFDTFILEADSADGTIPGASAFKLVTYMQHFGPQAYFVHIPSRFSPDGGPGYMCMAANFAEGNSQTQVDGVTRRKMTAVVHPTGGTYGINLQAVQFCGPKAGVACTPSAAHQPVDHAGHRRAAVGEAEAATAASGSSTAADPDYPVGQTAVAIWIDTNVVASRANASAAGFGSFHITPAASPLAPLAERLFRQLVGAAVYATGVSYFNITAPNQFAPQSTNDTRSALGAHAFADKDCTHTVLVLANADTAEKVMDGAGGEPLWYLHREVWVLTMGGTDGKQVLLNGRAVGGAVAGAPLPSVSGHAGRGFGVFTAPPRSVSFLRLGLIPNCRQCEQWTGSNSSCIP